MFFKFALGVAWAAAFTILSPGAAEAYVDPGTGGLFYQIIVLVLGAVAGYFAVAKRFIKRFFGRRPKDSDDPDN